MLVQIEEPGAATPSDGGRNPAPWLRGSDAELRAAFDRFVEAGQTSHAGKVLRELAERTQALRERLLARTRGRYVAVTDRPPPYLQDDACQQVLLYVDDLHFVEKQLYLLYVYLRQPEITTLVIERPDLFRDASVLQLLVEAAARNLKRLEFGTARANPWDLSYERLRDFAEGEIARTYALDDDFPVELNVITALSNCNLKCRMCLQAYQTYKGRQVMDLDLFRLTVDNVPADRPVKIGVSPFTEPFAVPGMLEFVRVARQMRPQAFITLNTNAVLMTEDLCHELVASGLDLLVLSLNVTTREDFAWFTGRDDFDRACENIRRLRRIRDAAGAKRPTMSMQLVRMPRNEGRYEAFQREWAPYVDHFAFANLDDQAATVDIDGEIFQGCDYHHLIRDDLICQSPWTSMTVNWKGDIYPCCSSGFNDWHDTSLRLGNVRTDRLTDVWRGERLRQVRHRQYAGTDENCARCRYKGMAEARALILEEAVLKLP